MMISNIDIMHVIKNIESNATKSEQKIINTILKDPHRILNMTADELGTEADSSAASVIRLCKKLGLSGFPQLKILLSKHSDGNQTDKYTDITPHADVDTVKTSLLNNTHQTLSETAEIVDELQIKKTVQEIHSATLIYIFGIGSSYLSALNLSQKFERIGKVTVVLSDPHLMISSMASKSERCIFIGVSNSGETKEVVELLKIANELNMTTIAITQYGSNTLAKASDVTIQHAYPKEPLVRSSASASLHAQFFILDLLFHAYASEYYDEVIEPLDATLGYIKKYEEGE